MANNAGYKPNEGKREEFRRYLEKTGVMDALTKVLVLLYEEGDKPDDAIKFILNALAKQIGSETIDELKTQLAELQERFNQMESDNRNLSEGGAAPPAEAPPAPEAAQEGAEEVKAEDAESAPEEAEA